MIVLNRRTKIFVCKNATDMRASYDSLFSRVKGLLQQDPFSGHLFLFINLRRTSCKCLYYDGTGLVIVSKRLEKGLFCKINPFYQKEIVLTAAEFGLFFEGADLNKRFIESPKEMKKVGIKTDKNGKEVRFTNFPSKKFSSISHVRPHAKDASDTYPLPKKDKLTKQMEYTKHCFWLNNSYIRDEIFLKY